MKHVGIIMILLNKQFHLRFESIN